MTATVDALLTAAESSALRWNRSVATMVSPVWGAWQVSFRSRRG